MEIERPKKSVTSKRPRVAVENSPPAIEPPRRNSLTADAAAVFEMCKDRPENEEISTQIRQANGRR